MLLPNHYFRLLHNLSQIVMCNFLTNIAVGGAKGEG